MTKDEYILRFRRFQRSRENHFAPKINEALHKQYLQAVRNIHLGENAVNWIDSDGIMKVIRNLYMDAGIVYGAKIRADFAKQGAYKIALGVPLPTLKNTNGIKFTELKARGAMGFSEHMAQLIAEYFRMDILNTSEGITQTTRDLIKQVFTDAYKLGLGINEIVKKLENTELSKIRARMIARTETVRAANRGALMVAKDTGLLLNKQWLATKDSRTRDDHREVDGHQVGRDDYFIVGGFEMLVPGDAGGHDGRPLVSPSEYVNCRCSVTFTGVRDSAGRLIRA